MKYKILNDQGTELDFFNEISKYAGFLRGSHISRHLALYELYKKTMELPGSVGEFGVYNGSSFFFLARLIEIFHSPQHETHHSSTRHLFGFERFDGFKEISSEDRTEFKEPNVKKPGGLKSDRESFFTVLDFFRKESAIRDRLHIIDGDIVDTFPTFLKEFQGVRFCYCLLDFDLYEPSKIVLDELYEKMVKGGIIIFDEYGFPDWPGETLAVDEFIKRYKLKLRSTPWTFAPSAYCIIE
jgi:hypothetical protein